MKRSGALLRMLVVAGLAVSGLAMPASAAPTRFYDLIVTPTGPTNAVGTGTVTSAPAGISCGSDCSETLASGTKVTLTAVADAGSTFVGWGGACAGTGTCAVTMKQRTTVTASFGLDRPLTVSVIPGGRDLAGGPIYSGRVVSEPSRIDCGEGPCTANFAYGSTVRLTATPDDATTTRFVGWSGCTTNSGSTCTVTMNDVANVAATFSYRTTWTLSVSVPAIAEGAGRIVSSPSGIDCATGSDTCSATFDTSTTVVLSATSSDGTARLDAWGGGCAGVAATSTCVVDVGAEAVTATFVPIYFALNVTVASLGGGQGAVAAADGSITCGSGTCSRSYLAGRTVSLTATPADGANFTGWSGACRGTTQPCVVTMSQARTVTASFDRPQTLTIAKAGPTAGTVTSSPAGISCDDLCTGTSADFAYATSITLTAIPAVGGSFGGWSESGCGFQLTCTFSLTSTRTVTATFTSPSFTVTLTKRSEDGGTGTVSSSPTGISCGPGCSSAPAALYGTGTTVRLTASASRDSVFKAWEGDCTRILDKVCEVDVDAAKSIVAVFARPALRITTTSVTGGTGAVAMTSSAKGTSCGTSCTIFPVGTTVTLKATAAAGSTFAGWSGACTGTGDCVVSMTAQKNVTAVFVGGPITLTVVAPSGGSVVATSPTGIDCGSTCTSSYAYGTVVTLEARAAEGYVFTGWGGACASTGTATTCTVTMTDVRSVSATFAPLG